MQYIGGSVFLSLIFMLVLTAGLSVAQAADGNQTTAQGGTGSFPPSPEGKGPGQSGQGEMKGPPQAAIDACSGKAEGSACQCQGPNGTEAGTCKYTPDKKYCACMPDSMKPPAGKPGQKPEGSDTGR